jgi:hypothetical protein
MNPSLYQLLDPCDKDQFPLTFNSFDFCSCKQGRQVNEGKSLHMVYLRLDQNGFSKKKIMNQLKPIQRQTNLIIKKIAPIDAFSMNQDRT